MIRQKIINWISRNTIMNGFISAELKVGLTLIPLMLGLFTYKFLEVDFFKSMLLYFMALSFDFGLKYYNAVKFKNVGIVLHLVTLILFATSFVMTCFSIIGVLNNAWLVTNYGEILSNLEFFVYLGVVLQIIWYIIEAVLLVISEMLMSHTPKTRVKMSHPSDISRGI